MTETYFTIAAILLFVYIFITGDRLTIIAIALCVALGLASGYGVLPAWQG